MIGELVISKNCLKKALYGIFFNYPEILFYLLKQVLIYRGILLAPYYFCKFKNIK